KNANRLPLSQKRDAEDSAKVANCCQFTCGIFRVSKHIRDLNGFALQQNSGHHTTASRRILLIPLVFVVFWCVTVTCCYVVACILPTRSEDCTLISLAKLSRRLYQCLKDDLQIESRATNDLEHFGRGPLPLQRLVQLASKPGDFRFLAGSG